MTPYGDKDLGQQWRVGWRHQAITWTNVDWSSAESSDIHKRAISQEMPQLSITKICLKITYIKFYSNLPGANELSVQFKLISVQDKMHPNFKFDTSSHGLSLENCRHFPDDIFKWIFLNENICISI